VHAVVGEPETHQHGFEPGLLAEQPDDGDRPAALDKDRVRVRGGLERPARGLEVRRIRRDGRRGAAAVVVELPAAAGGRLTLEPAEERVADFLLALVRDEPERDLRARPRGDDGLRAGALIPAGDAVDLGGGSPPLALDG